MTPKTSPAALHHNKVEAKDRAVHDWYRFVLSFPPHLVQRYLNIYLPGNDGTVLDPFCGTGTTLVECQKQGIPCFGIEANPMAAFASRVKLDWRIDGRELWAAAQHVAKLSFKGLKGLRVATPDPLFAHTAQNGHALRQFPAAQEKLLLKNSISPVPLHKALVLRDMIDGTAPEFRAHLRLALAKALVAGASNLRFGPEVGVGKIKDDAPVIDLWLEQVSIIANDLDQLPRIDGAHAVIEADARCGVDQIPAHSLDFVFTSPPYPNEKDYSRTTRLESVLLGFLSSKEELREVKKRILRSNTRGVYKQDDDDQLVISNARVQQLAQEIEARRLELGKTSGFEKLYGRVTKLYFGGMARHFEGLKPKLKPGATLAYVVGDQASYLRVMIRTGQILGEIADDLGYEVRSLDLFRTRIATATKEQLREEVLILRWSGSK